ncbi:MAG TPA: carbonic anhydrase [Ktedonobacterales bacterium]
MATGTFGTAINCIDGRAQGPVADWVKMNGHVQYVDMITEPGADKVLAQGSPSRIESIKQSVLISVNAHKSAIIAIAGHHDCAANPVSQDEHFAHIRAAVQVVASWGLPVRIVGLWVNEWGYIEVVEAR